MSDIQQEIATALRTDIDARVVTGQGGERALFDPEAERLARIAAEACKQADHGAHAYIVEALWNRGSSSERWGAAMEMSDVHQPLDREDAEELMAEMIECGHAEDAVRLVGLVITAPEG